MTEITASMALIVATAGLYKAYLADGESGGRAKLKALLFAVFAYAAAHFIDWTFP